MAMHIFIIRPIAGCACYIVSPFLLVALRLLQTYTSASSVLDGSKTVSGYRVEQVQSSTVMFFVFSFSTILQEGGHHGARKGYMLRKRRFSGSVQSFYSEQHAGFFWQRQYCRLHRFSISLKLYKFCQTVVPKHGSRGIELPNRPAKDAQYGRRGY